jgi:hypothetical protein
LSRIVRVELLAEEPGSAAAYPYGLRESAHGYPAIDSGAIDAVALGDFFGREEVFCFHVSISHWLISTPI